MNQGTVNDAARRLRLLLDHMPDGVLAFDAKRRIEWINPAARRIFQVAAADIVGQPLAHWIDHLPEAVNEPGSGLPESLLPARPQRELVRARRSDGQPLLLELAHIDSSGDGTRVGMCVCRDVSESQRMERMQHEFVRMVSHELRTPLTSLRGSLALIDDGEHHDPGTRKMLRLAKDNVERLVLLVNDILDFETLRAGALRLDNEDLDLGAVAHQAVESLDGMARDAQVSLRVLADSRHGGYPVHADAQRLMQVLVNLLSNAIKHSPPGSEVEVRLRKDSERVRLTVADAGPGVPPAFVQRLFEPFQQAHQPGVRKRGGTGLGLAISRALMQMMGGAIGLEPPRPGKGARFWIELPLNQALPSTFGAL